MNTQKISYFGIVFYHHIKLDILIPIQIYLRIVSDGRHLKAFAIGLAGNVPFVDEAAVGIDGELLVSTGNGQDAPMGEGALGERDYGDKTTTDIIVMFQVVNPGIGETSKPVISKLG